MNKERHRDKVAKLMREYDEEKKKRIHVAELLLKQEEAEASKQSEEALVEQKSEKHTALPSEAQEAQLKHVMQPEKQLALSSEELPVIEPHASDDWHHVVTKGKSVTMLDLFKLLTEVRNEVNNVKIEVNNVKKVVNNVKEEVNNVKEEVNNVKKVVNNVKEEVKEEVNNVKKVVNNVKEEVNNVKEEVNNVKKVVNNVKIEVNNVKKVVNNVKEEVKSTNWSLSVSFERSCRSSFCLFLEGRLGVKASQPILAKKLPNVSSTPLEDIAVLCLKASMQIRDVPDLAEIDVIVQLNKGSDDKRYISPSAAGSSSSKSMHGPFAHLAIGEVSRSDSLCCNPDQFQHFKVPTYSASSKLLYKFVQVERGLSAAKDYYGLSNDGMLGAAIMSPSFRALSRPDELVAAVLTGHPNAFHHVARLHSKNCMWLLDI